MSHDRVSRNDPCPCGSGKKYKRCCGRDTHEPGFVPLPSKARKLAEEAARIMANYPLGTIARYGPDDRTATKIAAAVFAEPDGEPILERWMATDIDNNATIQEEIMAFFKTHEVRKIVAASEMMGCPHEEGQDFPDGEDCPFCPFWRGKQGTARRD